MAFRRRFYAIDDATKNRHTISGRLPRLHVRPRQVEARRVERPAAAPVGAAALRERHGQLREHLARAACVGTG